MGRIFCQISALLSKEKTHAGLKLLTSLSRGDDRTAIRTVGRLKNRHAAKETYDLTA
jgi:hypothetical protein